MNTDSTYCSEADDKMVCIGQSVKRFRKGPNKKGFVEPRAEKAGPDSSLELEPDTKKARLQKRSEADPEKETAEMNNVRYDDAMLVPAGGKTELNSAELLVRYRTRSIGEVVEAIVGETDWLSKLLLKSKKKREKVK